MQHPLEPIAKVCLIELTEMEYTQARAVVILVLSDVKVTSPHMQAEAMSDSFSVGAYVLISISIIEDAHSSLLPFLKLPTKSVAIGPPVLLINPFIQVILKMPLVQMSHIFSSDHICPPHSTSHPIFEVSLIKFAGLAVKKRTLSLKSTLEIKFSKV